MAVTFDAVGPSASGAVISTGATSLTWSHTCTGASLLLVMCQLGHDGSSVSGQTMSATYGGVAMTSLGVTIAGSSTTSEMQVWQLINPAAGTANVVVTGTGTISDLCGGSLSFKGSDLTTPLVGAAFTTGADASSASKALTSTGTGSMCVSFLSVGGGGIATGNTSRFISTPTYLGNAGGCTAGATAAGTGGTVTMSYTFTLDANVLWTAEIVAAAADVPVPPPVVPPGLFQGPCSQPRAWTGGPADPSAGPPDKTGGAAAGPTGIGTKADELVGTGGGAVGITGIGTKADELVGTGGAVAGPTGIGTKSITLVGTGGGAAGTVGVGTKADELVGTGGAITSGAGVGTKSITLVGTGGAIASAAGSGAKTIIKSVYIETGGGGAAGTGIGTKSVTVVKAGGAVATGAGIGTKSVALVGTGSAVATALGSGGKTVAGGATTYTKTGGAVTVGLGSGPARITSGWLYAGAATGLTGSWATTDGAVGSIQGDYATWTSLAASGTAAALELATFGGQAAVPADAPLDTVDVRVRHSEAPADQVATVTAQAYLGATPVGSPTAMIVSDTVREDTITVSGLTYADLADLRVRVVATRN